MEAVLERLPRNFGPMKRDGYNFVSRIRARGGDYWSGVWLALGHPKFDNARDGPMFQFGLWKKRVFSCGIWMQGFRSIVGPRRLVWSVVNGNPRLFMKLVRKLGKSYYLDLYDNESEFRWNAREFGENELENFLDILADRSGFINISRELSNGEVIAWKENAAREIAGTFIRLYPLYSFLISGRSRGGVFLRPRKFWRVQPGQRT